MYVFFCMAIVATPLYYVIMGVNDLIAVTIGTVFVALMAVILVLIYALKQINVLLDGYISLRKSIGEQGNLILKHNRLLTKKKKVK